MKRGSGLWLVEKWLAIWSVSFSVIYVYGLAYKLGHPTEDVAVIEPALILPTVTTWVMFAAIGSVRRWFD